MTVDDAIEVLTKISAGGKGSYPFQFMTIDDGITFADDIKIIEAGEFDGERVWAYATDKHAPEWMVKANHS